MPRTEGFTTANISTAILADPKIGRLWRQVNQDEALMDRAYLVYLATVTESWGAGRRMTADEAVPWWMSSQVTEAIDALVQVGLLVTDHRIPTATWDAWFSPAVARRNALRTGGRLGADRRWGREPEHENMGTPSPGHRPANDQPNGQPMATTVGTVGRKVVPGPTDSPLRPMASHRPGHSQAIPEHPLDLPAATRAPGEAAMPIHDGRHGPSCLVCNPPKPERKANGAPTPKPPAPAKPGPRPQVDNPVDNPEPELDTI